MEKFLRRPEVESITGLSRSAIYACMERGEFPRPRRIGRHAVAWRESDIEAWVMSRQASGSGFQGFALGIAFGDMSDAL